MRWFAFSAFTPMFRAHGRPSYLHNPWGWKLHQSLEEIPLEGAALPRANPPPSDALPDDRVEEVCRGLIRERYKLLPYLYTLAREASQEGLPMMRPLWFYAPDDPEALSVGHEYFLGKCLLVAPVTAKGAKSWRVYLPEGTWYDYWTLEKFEGGKAVTADAEDFARIPVFVRAGSLLPRGPVTQSVAAEPRTDWEEVTLAVYEGADGEFTLYEDDGISLGYRRGECTRTAFCWDDGRRDLTAKGVSSQFTGREREFGVTILPSWEERTLRVAYSKE